jgi:antitoxin FitA
MPCKSGMIADCCESQQNDSMASITIRDVPDDTRDELAARAAASGRSMQEYLRSQLVALASRPDSRVLVEQIRDRKRHTGSALSADVILGHRDADRT